jgi:Putative DNA-binding domain
VSENLTHIQTLFAEAIQKPTPVADQPAILPFVEAHVAGSARMTPVEQLDVYREQFWMRHVDALHEDFVTIHHLLGHDAFETLCAAYLKTHPPADYSLRDLGAKLCAFVLTTEPYCNDQLVASCACIEWAFVDAFDAADAEKIDASAIAAVPEDAWDRVRVSLHPSLQLCAMPYPAHDYRAAVRAGQAPDRPKEADSCVAVFRGEQNLMFTSLERPAFDLLRRLRGGDTLGEACEVVARWPGAGEDFGQKVGPWFQSWTGWGWVTALRI